ncbi:MAG TPA: amidohydrolase family protein [Sphingomonadaceae bacterium]|nr:amidohydrolase family protein [Sphingomonadaceae bacterium]
MLAAAAISTTAESRRREPAPTPPPPSAGGLVDNINGYMFDRAGNVTRFNGLLIGKDGRVAKLLENGDKRPERLDFRLDGHGRTLLPGLVDAHAHLIALGRRAIALDLGDALSPAAMQAELTDYARTHGTPLWIRGSGWNEAGWGLGRLPTAADIDAAVADRPVVIDLGEGGGLLANKAAMAAAGINAKTADPAGGRIVRGPDGRPTGLFVGTAEALILAAMPRMLPRERDEALVAAQLALIRAGVTAATDMGTSIEDWTAFRRAGDAGRLRLRILSYAAGIDPLLAVAGTGPTPWLYDGRLRMIGVALVADGGLDTRGAWFKADYADAPGEHGLRYLDDAKLRNLMSRAAMDHFQVAVDATGDAAVAQVLGAIEEEVDTYKGDRRWRIEQARFVDPADLPRFAHHGIIASMQPGRAVADRPVAAARLDPARAGTGAQWPALAGEGVPLAFGSAVPSAMPAPFADLAAAVTGGQDGTLTIAEALGAYTAGAAYAGFAEGRLGTLAPGAMADFILIDRDVMATPSAAAETQVLETWIGGKRLWVRGHEQNVIPLPPAGDAVDATR